MEIRFLRGHEVHGANQLIIEVFLEDIAPNYEQEGIDEFFTCFEDENILSLMKDKQLFMLGAFDSQLIGVIGLRDFSHIQSLFVKKEYQHQGVGTLLMVKAKQLVYGELSVNADVKAVEFYQRQGFHAIDIEQCVHGIHFVPMVYESVNENLFQTYDDVHTFISNQKDRVYALDNFKKFMNDFCNPQVLLKSIHIGGTNGKGSTTNYIRSVLQKEGYNVATFTSPVLVTRLEIMRINNQHIEDKEIIQYANRYMSVWLKYELSMFEIEVFIAIMFFLKHRVDFAIFEVGLGGELDATNIITPIIAANTNIGLDHVDYLGDTYEKIALTKVGIIKDYIPFVTGETKQECLDVFKKLCEKHHSPLLKVKNILNIHEEMGIITYDYDHHHIELNTAASYQIENSALAIEILLYLKENGYIELKEQYLIEGLKQAVWEGRFEVIHHNPLIIIDGAHNKEGMEAFYQSAQKFTNIKIIFSALRDKDTHGMMEKLVMLTDDITVCEFDFYRAQTAEKLAESFPVKIEKNWRKAVDDAFLHDGTVFITGSLYFIAQVRAYILAKDQ